VGRILPPVRGDLPFSRSVSRESLSQSLIYNRGFGIALLRGWETRGEMAAEP
jgi:hypothetical protein